MALKHAEPGEVFDLSGSTDGKSTALVKHNRFEVMRLSLAAGQSIAPHKMPDPITIQCLAGKCNFSVEDEPRDLKRGSWLFLEGGTIHAVEATEDTQLLLTVFFSKSGVA